MALTKISNNSLSSISTLPASIPTGSLTLISTQTASSSASIEFTSGIDSTYSSYIFSLIDIHPNGTNASFTFQADTGTNTNYNQTMTTTLFYAYNLESDAGAALQYVSSADQAQGTSFQTLTGGTLANDADTSLVGNLQIFNPSSDTFVKHFICRTQSMFGGSFSVDDYIAGYFNIVTPITRLKFQMDTGTFDGIIKMYGVS